VISRLLQSEHDVFVLSNPREALPRIAAGESFDVVFCDLMMPEMTGMDFFAALQAVNPEFARRIVFITAGAFSARTEEFISTTGNAMMMKPFDPSALRRVVIDYVAAAHALQAELHGGTVARRA
jgi:two-component system NtrC family sensor kinase